MSASSYLVFSSACAMLHCVTPICLHRRVATRFPSLRYSNSSTSISQRYGRVTPIPCNVARGVIQAVNLFFAYSIPLHHLTCITVTYVTSNII